MVLFDLQGVFLITGHQKEKEENDSVACVCEGGMVALLVELIQQ